MSDKETRKHIFNEIPELYDEMRPHYPEALVEDALRLADIPDDGRILEIGSGTGQATVAFARRGYQMLCLELGDKTAELARRNLQDYPKVEVRTTSFEEWPLQPQAFDLAIAASAFHWIAPEVGYPKVAAALKAGGAFAILRNAAQPETTDFYRELQQLYRAYMPESGSALPRPYDPAAPDSQVVEFDASGLFGPVTVLRYPWTRAYTAEQYPKLLDTYSNHYILPAEAKDQLYRAITDLITRHGGTYIKPYVAMLYLAKKI